MSSDNTVRFNVSDDVLEEAERLVNQNRNNTNNSPDSNAFYGRKLFQLGIKYLQEKEREKQEKAVDFKKTRQEIKDEIENGDLSGVLS